MSSADGPNVDPRAFVAQAEAVQVTSYTASASWSHVPVTKIFPLSRAGGEERWGASSTSTIAADAGGGDSRREGTGAALLYKKACGLIGKKEWEMAEVSDRSPEAFWKQSPDGVMAGSSMPAPVYVPRYLFLSEKSTQQDLVANNDELKVDAKSKLYFQLTQPQPPPPGCDTVQMRVPVSMLTTYLEMKPEQRIGPFLLDPNCGHVIENRSTVPVMVVGKHCSGYLEDEPHFSIMLPPKGSISIDNVKFEITVITMGDPTEETETKQKKRRRKKRKKDEEGGILLKWFSMFVRGTDKMDEFLSWASRHQPDQPARDEHQLNPPARGEHQLDPPARDEHQLDLPARDEHQLNPPARDEHQLGPPTRDEDEDEQPTRIAYL